MLVGVIAGREEEVEEASRETGEGVVEEVGADQNQGVIEVDQEDTGVEAGLGDTEEVILGQDQETEAKDRKFQAKITEND